MKKLAKNGHELNSLPFWKEKSAKLGKKIFELNASGFRCKILDKQGELHLTLAGRE